MKQSKTATESESATRIGLRKLIPAMVFVVCSLVAWLVTHDDPAEHPVARAISCLLAAGLVVLWRYLPAAGEDGELVRRHARSICGLLLVAWAGTTVGATLSFELKRLLSRGSVRVHTTFHYYMGPKYFAELGYTDLYEQTLAVDRENAQYWTRSIGRIRDLRTYQKHHLSHFRIQRSEAFSDERWQAFGEDVRRIQIRRPPVVWRGIFSDRGYNATPFGVAVGRLVSQVPASKLGLAFLGLLDPLLLLVAFIFLGQAFGSKKALLAAGWFLIFYGNEHHLIGRMFIHDYLIALLFMAWAIKRERPATAGVFLAYATMLRVFPGALLAGLLVWSFVRRLRDGKIPRFSKRLVVSFCLACTLFGLLSFAHGRGPQAWVESIDNLKLHGQHHRFGNRRIGLQHLFVHDWSHGFKAEPKSSRQATWPAQRWAWMLSGVLCLGLWGWSMWKHTPDDPLEAMLLGLVIVFIFLVLSRYYWVVACLMLLLGNRTRAGPVHTWLQAGLFVHVALFYFWSVTVGSDFSQYLGANLLWLAWLAAAMILPIVLKSRKPPEMSAR